MRSLKERLISEELRGKLCRWGDWIERHEQDASLPRCTAFNVLPAGYPGHRILCAEMSKKVYFTHQAILKLEKQEQNYLKAWYAWSHDEQGHWLDQRQKADELGIKYMTFASHVHRSRKKLLNLRKIWFI